MKTTEHPAAEVGLVAALLVGAILMLVFIGDLVAEPKLLFGRALTAIAPSLFPTIALGAIATLAGGFLLIVVGRRASTITLGAGGDRAGALRMFALFAIMTGYALAMAPLGFLISTVIAIILVSLLAGNRNLPQILAVSIASPIVLYLVATRLLAVSLPELSPIEFAYSRILDG